MFRTLTLVLAMLAGPLQLVQACDIKASLRFELIEGLPVLDATVAGSPVKLLLDTGSEGNLLTPTVIRRLHLPPAPDVVVQGTGGARSANAVLVHGLRLGSLAIPDSSAPVLGWPIGGGLSVVDGLLGLASLRGVEVDLNLPKGVLNLQSPCFTFSADALALGSEGTVAVTVNGKTMRALIDTGSRGTIVSPAAAKRLGLDAPVVASTSRGLDGKARTMRFTQLQTVQAGAARRQDVAVSISELEFGQVDMLIGMDFLTSYRLRLNAGQTKVSIEAP